MTGTLSALLTVTGMLVAPEPTTRSLPGTICTELRRVWEALRKELTWVVQSSVPRNQETASSANSATRRGPVIAAGLVATVANRASARVARTADPI